MINKNLLEIKEYRGEGYVPLVDSGTWRVAILNYCSELETQNITSFQKHNESDEVFILLKGQCTLFIGTGENGIGEIKSENLEEGRVYCVKRGTYHSHTLSVDASVIVVENRDTCNENSPILLLTYDQRQCLATLS